MKPAHMSSKIDKCMLCGRPGEVVWYLPLFGEAPIDCLEAVVNHSINGQKQKWRPKNKSARNDFHRTGYLRHALADEIRTRYSANPRVKPDVNAIVRSLRTRKEEESKKVIMEL
jgi:hypothetical protein